MKVTIINNGKTKMVLKPSSQQEILAVKEMSAKKLITVHYESTMILNESYPDCLVIEAQEIEEKKPTLTPTIMVVIVDARNNYPIATIPEDKASKERIIDAIQTALDVDYVETNDSIQPSNKVSLYVNISAGENSEEGVEFLILKVPIL